MPIVVKHGGSFGNAGQIAAQAIQADLDRQSARARQMDALKVQGAIASHQAQMRYHAEHEANQTAIRIAAMRSGLAEDMQREEYMQSLAQAQEAGRQQAKQVEYTYTTQQRIDDAKYAKAERLIRTSTQFTPQEKEQALQRLSVARAGIREPTEILGDPNKPKYPEGKEPGNVWAGAQDGSWTQGYFATDPKTGTAKLLVRPDQTPEFHQQKAEFEFRQKELEFRAKQQESIVKARIELLSKPIRFIDPRTNIESERFRTDAEIDQIISRAFGLQQPNPQQPQPQVRSLAPEEYPPQSKFKPSAEYQQNNSDIPWWERAAKSGIETTENDRALPQMVGLAQAFVRQYGRGGRQAVPAELRRAYDESLAVLQAHQAQMQGVNQ